MPRTTAIIVAAGHSTRMGGAVSKQFLPLGEMPVIVHTLLAFQQAEAIDRIVLVARKQDEAPIMDLAAEHGISKLQSIAEGGETRQQSVTAGLRLVDEQCDYLAIHDGARPLITPEEIDGVVRAAFEKQAVAVAVPVKDTIKVADREQRVVSTPDRSTLWSIQTPQVFEAGLYRRALDRAEEQGKDYTDDCQLVESMGAPVFLHTGSYRNIKITTVEDLPMAELFLKDDKSEETDCRVRCPRVGHGYDVHQLVEGRKLIIGGVEIPHNTGLLGHSDADVLAHAIADALLGAAALGDIGTHFPDDDPTFENADSMVLLRRVCGLIRGRGFAIGNIDATVVAQAPKLKPYIARMRSRLAEVCSISEDDVNIKATTEEKLGFTGRCEGISAHAVGIIL